MNLKPEREDNVEVNLTPLIDVVFLLLIFFMVSTTFQKQAKLKVELPEASAQAQQQQDNSIIIGIDAKGEYYINDRQVVNTTIKTLKLAIQKTIGDGDLSNTPIILKADAKTPHESVVRVMDAASQLGMTLCHVSDQQCNERSNNNKHRGHCVIEINHPAQQAEHC